MNWGLCANESLMTAQTEKNREIKFWHSKPPGAYTVVKSLISSYLLNMDDLSVLSLADD